MISSSCAERLIDEFEEGETVAQGIANVLKHLANVFEEYCDCDDASLIGVPVSTLEDLAEKLESLNE
jgi:hypothetical protein